MVRWFAGFLEGRQGRVRVGGGRSKWRRFQEGLPQGAVSSPALFLLYANEWVGLMEEGVGYSGFADDLALWASGRELGEVVERLQRALDIVDEWADRNRIELNPRKSECCVFSKDKVEKERQVGLKVGGREIECKKEVVFLGVTVDQGLIFGRQVEKVIGKMRRKIGVIRALAGRS